MNSTHPRIRTTGAPVHATLCPSRLSRTAWAAALVGVVWSSAQAQEWVASDYPVGITGQGNSGGLVIPYADVLKPGAVGLAYGNYREPLFGAPRATERNAVLGFGLWENVEFFGRLAEVTNPTTTGLVNGARDISANLKVQLPELWYGGPVLALGINDLNGGANYFRSVYGVASASLGGMGVTVGYAKGKASVSAPGLKPAFDGPFAGVSIPLGETGLAALAEREGKQTHLGLRWTSDPLSSLANARISASVQRSTSRQSIAGLQSPDTFAGVSVVIPVGDDALRAQEFQPAPETVLPPIEPATGKPAVAMKATLADRLDSLRQRLTDVGLERVRVGLQAKALVVQYENHRYAHNEADALGLVFGLAAEAAKTDATRIYAIILKNGLPVSEVTVDVAAYREFLRDGMPTRVQSSLTWSATPSIDLGAVAWQGEKGGHSPLRVEIRPDLNYTIGTEVGVFDHALAANIGLSAPLWPGAQAFLNYIQPIGHSNNMNDGAVFSVLRQPSGVRAAALQQSFWLGDHLFNQVALGRFHYDVTGVQAESRFMIPDSDDVIRLAAAAYNKVPGGLVLADAAASASYRHQFSPSTALEVGAQQYTDGSRGPSVEWSRWFGDMNVQLFFRKGSYAKFAGLQLSIPLTPRQGMQPGTVFFTGAGQHAQSVRTRITDSRSPANTVMPGGVTPLKFETALTTDAQFNFGRMSAEYLRQQTAKMRESFYIHTTSSQKTF